MPGQHALAKFVDFAKGYGLKAACPLKAKAETADAAEQVQHAQLRRCGVTFSVYLGSVGAHWSSHDRFCWRSLRARRSQRRVRCVQAVE